MKLTYDEISPITNNRCVLVEFDDLHGETRLCMESGYQHLQQYIVGDDVCDKFEMTCPEYIKQTKFIDNLNRVWYKLIIVTPTLVMLPFNTNDWKIMSLRPSNENEDISMSEFTLVNNDVIMILDEPSAVLFNNFTDAIDNFYKILTLNYD